jgi:hypothetical protein
MTINKDSQHIRITVFNQGRKVYTGDLSDLEIFFSRKQKADRVEIYNSDGSAVVTMRYQDFMELLEGKI